MARTRQTRRAATTWQENEDGEMYENDQEQEIKDDLTEAVEKGGKCEAKDMYWVPTKADPDKFEWVRSYT
jgi:hypothetical protein